MSNEEMHREIQANMEAARKTPEYAQEGRELQRSEQEQQCPICHGEGQLEGFGGSGRTQCHKCKGLGKIYVPPQDWTPETLSRLFDAENFARGLLGEVVRLLASIFLGNGKSLLGGSPPPAWTPRSIAQTAAENLKHNAAAERQLRDNEQDGAQAAAIVLHQDIKTLRQQLLSALAAIEKHNKDCGDDSSVPSFNYKIYDIDLSPLHEHDKKLTAEVRKPLVDLLLECRIEIQTPMSKRTTKLLQKIDALAKAGK